MDNKTWEEYRHLQNSGVDLEKENSIKFNAGGSSETFRHIISKSIAAKVCLQAGYRVNSEVGVPRGECDIVAYGHPKRLSYAIEVETNPSSGIKTEKLQKYVHETALDDMILIDLDQMGDSIPGAIDYIRSEIGL